MSRNMQARIYTGDGEPLDMMCHDITVYTEDGKWVTIYLEDGAINIHSLGTINITPRASNSIDLKIGR